MVASKELIANIKLGLKAFDAAAKNLVLYPETNEMRQQSIAILKNWLDPFLDEQTLRLHVAKGQLLYDDEVVFQDKSPESGIVSPLFRDGIHTLEIYQGVPLKELEKLLSLINTFRVIDEDQEDDMVTAMWEADFKFIKYNTADEFWETDDNVDVPTLNITSAADFRPSDNINENAGGTDRFEQRIKPFSSLFDDIQKEEEPSEEAEGESEEEAPDDSAYTPNQWQLYLTFTDEEKAHLAAMIDAEKRRNVIGDSLDVLINLMYCRPDHPDNTMVLEFLSEEIQEALAASNFEDVRKCIGAVMTFSQSGHPTLTSLATEFSRMMSSEAALKALERSWTDPDAVLTEEYYREVYNFLSTLPPDSASVLIGLLHGVRNQQIASILMWTIAYKAAYSSVNLSPAISKLPSAALLEMMSIFKSGQVPFPSLIVGALARHENSSVRQVAAQTLMDHDPGEVKVLFPLIKDPNPQVARMAFDYLSRQRNTQVERHMINHIKEIMEDGGYDDNHIMMCYATLGRCAMGSAIPFLENELLKKNLKLIFRSDNDTHRTGAAMGLMLMPPETGAEEVLNRAARSRLRGLRQTCEIARSLLSRNNF